ncbi:MAG: pckG [Parachlamydiales bacterium]|nr:pckG [Parachlamydiales bacterium]
MEFNVPLAQWTKNRLLIQWIEEQIALCQPSSVHLCDGSAEEYDRIAHQMTAAGVLVPLKKRPASYWCHTNPDDVARVEESTFICSKHAEDAGPQNHWRDPAEMKKKLLSLFARCMRGRTMYVIPYCMGPLASSYSRVGVEITDSPYVVLNMKIMTRMGQVALDHLGDQPFIPGLHSVGHPLSKGEKDTLWPCNPKERVIAHFPEEKSIYSFGSGYGGNALLGKKCLALRIASVLGKNEGWLAEHMMILGLTHPAGQKIYIAAAFPSACGKTNLAMLTPTLPGWKVECVGDDIAWMHIGDDGRLYAINPEAGFFGVAPGTSMKTNPNAMRTIEHDTLFTNTALTPDKDVWWEGIGSPPPAHLTSWLGVMWDPASRKPAAHPNSRFTVSAKQCPIASPAMEDPCGVPIAAILFGGRRNRVMPLVLESFSWNHGVMLGASLTSETTAAAKGKTGELRHDPFAMLPFCGYNMGDYFSHWLAMGRRLQKAHAPRIYSVNWFRTGDDGKFLWPGFGDNVRVLKWIFERVTDRCEAGLSPIGHLPMMGSIDLSNLNIPIEPLFELHQKEWMNEVQELQRFFESFGSRFPKALMDELHQLEQRINRWQDD